jgi:hypothetical protein
MISIIHNNTAHLCLFVPAHHQFKTQLNLVDATNLHFSDIDSIAAHTSIPLLMTLSHYSLFIDTALNYESIANDIRWLLKKKIYYMATPFSQDFYLYLKT